ncbi:acyl-CoA dehydrogenase [Pseudonocardia sp. KRD-184]|uniref:Acyl-CoA dehydrogenase n=1 Tax=Pseudonocardia oceani TaxID=2792013 RepID=A0ABS6UCU0_9PSEU|nr:acyl-CoA dehydrogenase [Pseudonocardia oceani]MBW0091740.1 acyl-CoA dehydrogenase [Pseudonocardia oceani]MBW0094416.1 acyl-CoA dehydrogenase [Pseudonocardia oceani]MBW0107929.1 acyl-CoA dehydrogenase [Pseudonocardia oceani]MBW0119977.1 acyl-CoA dehydrogenase [Pseudonocardia oceani]MBW0130057.1 acyl-CoA dehydrogenase [Pseudonocardia oceani]
MALAITDDHRTLAQVARSALSGQRAAARDLLDRPDEALPASWKELAGLGWLGLAVPEEHGGEGAGLPELAVVLEELGRVVAPGPFLPTVLASAVLTEAGTPELRASLLPGLADGSRTAAVGLGAGVTTDGTTASGDAGFVLGGGLAELFLLVAGDDVVVVEAVTKDVPAALLDRTRRGALVTLDAAPVLGVIPGGAAVARRLTRVLAAAEAAGIATACLETSVAYVQERKQFGRTVGTFQAVKHKAADLLLDAELAVAAAWDASRAPAGTPGAELAAAVAAARSVPGAVRAAETMIQLHGGIGFTWEHDAHLYLRRALTLAAVVAQTGDADRDAARLTRDGVTRAPDLDLPPEADAHRAAAREFVASIEGLDAPARRVKMVESGYLVPHWPPPWGRDASATEQLVIEQEFRGVDMPSLGITAWNIQTISQHGTPEQHDRWLLPALRGETEWCQLFSEPGAGSDAAAISTRGVRVDGGWRVSGQKVWTTRAHQSDWGFATVRTDSSGPKHSGITMMAIDLRSPGVDVRPLRELTGDALFNEVFLDDVFVPDSDVVGEVGQGWRVARATLGNERVSIGGGGAGTIPFRARDLLPLADASPDPHAAEREVGALVVEDLTKRLLLLRQAARAVGGTEPGPEGNLNKLFSSEHAQRVTALAVRLAGTAAVAGGNELVMRCYLWARCLTIAGGTSEIARNQVAERLLGLPRDPLIS